ncbi:MAG TPA: EAL domain-containing protein [Candidatus Competibacteraceae bacterium]|nr:EAL domain-containing protein [Candidatus Competibacteraceae bacterium]
MAEETGLILPLGDWVLREACRQVAKWRHDAWPDMRVAVNLSAMQFRQTDLAERVRSALDSAGVDAKALELEVTESLLMQDTERAAQILCALRVMGVTLAIDDFGTGYSSLAYLKQFPVNTLKIDRSFVCDINRDEGDAAICAVIIALAHNLRLDVVAEGVEAEAQRNWLHSAGCRLAQGFLLSKSLPADECAATFPSHGS